jgi:hypothetical protein
MKRLIIIFSVIALMFSCEKGNNIPTFDNMDVTSEFVLDNSIIISAGDCAGDPQTHTYICFDSVLNDSRCPEGVQCIWAGNAEVKFRFVDADKEPLFFNLNTLTSFTNDTIVGGYKFTLVALNPYPAIKDILQPRNYKAEIRIEKESR